MRVSWLLFFWCITLAGFGQYKRKPKDPFPKPPRFEQHGWLVEPGVSFPIAGIGNQPKESPFQNSTDSLLISTFNPSGKVGAYLGGGRYHIINNLYFFRYLDYGLSYTMLRGTEQVEHQLQTPQASLPLGNATSTFTDHLVNVFFNMNNTIPLSDQTFLQNSFGLLGSYHVITNRTNANGFSNANYPGNLRGELTYKFGFGFKPNNWLLIIPSVQTSLLNLYPFRGVNFSLPYFSSEYKPLVFSVRFLWLNTAGPKYCPPVDALDVPEGTEQQEE